MAHAEPTNIKPAGVGTIVIMPFNIGAGSTSGTVTITDMLPRGFVAIDAGELRSNLLAGTSEPELGHNQWACVGNTPTHEVHGASIVTCTNTKAQSSIAGGGGTPVRFAEGPGHPQPQVGISVTAPSTPGLLSNKVTVAGGGAPSPASTEETIDVSNTDPAFGFTDWNAWFSNADGTLDTRAGSHPYEATFAFDLASTLTATANGEPNGRHVAGGEARNIEVQLPPGVIGNPAAVAQCTRAELAAEECPVESQIGTVIAYFTDVGDSGFRVFNLTPSPGVAAEFGFNFEGVLNLLESSVRTGSDYGISTRLRDASQRETTGSVLTLWGVPGDPSHNIWRNGEPYGCTQEQTTNSEKCLPSPKPSHAPFLTLPTLCAGPQTFSIHATTWQEPVSEAAAAFESHDVNGEPIGTTGCEDLSFGPGLTVAPERSAADTPTGISLEVKPPLGGLEDVAGLGTSDLKHASGSAPPGFVINPGQASGLVACGETEAESAIGTESPATCPPASKVGTVKAKSPLLETAPEKELQGEVFLLRSNPPTIHLLIAASADGVNLKLVGIGHLNEGTGQVEVTFGEDPAVEAEDPFLRGHMALPQLPASDFKLSFEGGAKAALVTPSQCGTYRTEGVDFTPWASPFIPDFQTSAALAITSGPGGGPCPNGPLPFNPSLSAGSTNTEAGAFTGFTQLLSRGDGQQRIEKFQFKEPAGMAGMLSQVPLCPEPQASQGTCDEASKIGHAIVQSGPGNNPLTLPQPGGPEIPIYLTGPYHGAPFGLSIKTPVIAGPFNLGTIVTRAKIEVDPTTAQITIATDALPQILDGVPTDLRSIYAVIDRQGFLFNPTNCTPQEFVGTATSAGGAAVAPISSHFGIGACRALKFAPKFTASTAGKASKAGGASLDVKVAASGGPQPGGGEANIRSVKVALPVQLPSRLTTLQKACLAAVFEANPASCPKESNVGTATAKTPILTNPLTGPAYLVSHGGAAFPDLEIVLQGEGIKLVLDGQTDIKKGITTSTFNTVPDAPISSFELNLPTGPFSVLGAYVAGSNHYNFCGQSLTLPTTITAQNGALITQTTKLGVTGCPPSVAISKTAVKGNSVAVTVKLGQQGTVKITGRGLRTTTKRGLKAGTHTITVPLTAVGRAAKQHGRRLTIHAALTVAGKTGTATTTLRA
jgi:hypothetical protein